jgi:hypothetical protein
VVVLVSIVLLPGVWIAGLYSAQQAASDLISSSSIGGTPTGGFYKGNVNFIVNQQDYLAGTAASPTSPTYRLYSAQPAQAAGGEALTVSGTIREIGAAEQGYVWIACYGGTDFYIAANELRTMNPRVKEGYWADLDQDHTPEYVVKIDLRDIGVTGQAQNPTYTLKVPLIKADTSLTDDSPAAVTSIGTSEVVKTVTWKVSGGTSKYGTFFSRIYVTLNCTEASGLVKAESMTLSGGMVVSSGAKTYWSEPITVIEGSTSYWYYLPQGSGNYKDYFNGVRVWEATNEADALYISINFRCSLGSGNNVVATLYYETVSSNAGALASVNDSVNLSA